MASETTPKSDGMTAQQGTSQPAADRAAEIPLPESGPKDEISGKAPAVEPVPVRESASAGPSFEKLNHAVVSVAVDQESVNDMRKVGYKDSDTDFAKVAQGLEKDKANLEALVAAHPDLARKDLIQLREELKMDTADRSGSASDREYQVKLDKLEIDGLREAMAKAGVKETQGTGHGVTAAAPKQNKGVDLPG